MWELTRIASASAGASPCDCERGPKRAQQRPPRADVGVWAVTRPSAGSKGWNPSTPSWWCSACCSCTPLRRTRCCSHHSPSPLARSAARPQTALRGWQEAVRRCLWTPSRWSSSGRARLQRAGAQELVPSAMCPPRCAAVPGEAGHEGRTAAERRAWCPWPPGRPVRTHSRAGGPGMRRNGRGGDLGMTRVVSEALGTAVMYT